MTLESANQLAHEQEVTLVICSEKPEDLEEELEGLTNILGYHLSEEFSQLIDDEYLDSRDGTLAAANWALRIRRVQSGYWITLKGPSRFTEWEGLERVEMEVPWSNEGLAKVLLELGQLESIALAGSGDFDPANPADTMKSLGFRIIQKRRLRRRGKAVSEQKGSPEIAELAIDDVTYQFAAGEILHNEVEIETKAAGGARVVKELAKELLSRYEPELQRWPYGKLATGRAIEQLLVAGKLTDSMNGNRLKAPAYTIIAEFLSRRVPEKQKAP